MKIHKKIIQVLYPKESLLKITDIKRDTYPVSKGEKHLEQKQ